MLFNPGPFMFGFTQGFVVGPITIFGIQEGLNAKKGFWYQVQVLLGAALVDMIYLMLAAYGAAQFIDNSIIRLVMWSLAAFFLIHMGINSLMGKPHKVSFHHMHRNRGKFFETDFFKGFSLNVVNPMAIVFWLMVAGSLYSQYQGVMTPPAFALNIEIGGLISSLLVAVATIFVRKIFHESMLKNLIRLGSFMLIIYGIWFMGKAAFEAGPIVASILSI